MSHYVLQQISRFTNRTVKVKTVKEKPRLTEAGKGFFI